MILHILLCKQLSGQKVRPRSLTFILQISSPVPRTICKGAGRLHHQSKQALGSCSLECMLAPEVSCISTCIALQGMTYRAAFQLDLCYQREGQGIQRLVKRLGTLPIMVRSERCYLRRFNRSAPCLLRPAPDGQAIGAQTLGACC